MSKTEVDFDALASYLPSGSTEAVLRYIHLHKVQLTITRRRKTLLGDYRHAHNGKGHRISVNGDLNKYAFLITLLHETAHLITFEQYGRKARPHGIEWKMSFGGILKEFMGKGIFPDDIEAALFQSLTNPAASSCADEKLQRILKKFDTMQPGISFVEQVPIGEKFQTPDGRIFENSEKVRKRFKCKEIATGKWYLFSPVYEVSRAG